LAILIRVKTMETAETLVTDAAGAIRIDAQRKEADKTLRS